LYALNFIWRPGSEVVVSSVDFGIVDAASFRSSPLAIVYEKEQEVRYRLDDPESARFPFFDEMRAEGVTDYIAMPLRFVDGLINGASWTTQQPGGFSDEHLQALRSLVPPLARVIEIISLGRKASNLLDTCKILYGNIGGGNRLDFTCIGPAVNLAARLEKIAGRLHRTIVASADFSGNCACEWTDLGEFPIAGFARAERVYGLPDEAPAA
jgi:hypothetical protein